LAIFAFAATIAVWDVNLLTKLREQAGVSGV
jgi:hypothetical protein